MIQCFCHKIEIIRAFFTYVICNLQEEVKCLARLLYSSPRQCSSAQCSNMKGVFNKFLMSYILLSWPLTTFLPPHTQGV